MHHSNVSQQQIPLYHPQSLLPIRLHLLLNRFFYDMNLGLWMHCSSFAETTGFAVTELVELTENKGHKYAPQNHALLQSAGPVHGSFSRKIIDKGNTLKKGLLPSLYVAVLNSFIYHSNSLHTFVRLK